MWTIRVMDVPQRVLFVIVRFKWCPVYVFSPFPRLSLHVLNGGRQCMCAIADTLLNGVRGCGHSILFVHRTAEPTTARHAASPLSVIRHSRATPLHSVKVQTSSSTARPNSSSPAPTTRSPQREPYLGPPRLSSQKDARPALEAPSQLSE